MLIGRVILLWFKLGWHVYTLHCSVAENYEYFTSWRQLWMHHKWIMNHMLWPINYKWWPDHCQVVPQDINLWIISQICTEGAFARTMLSLCWDCSLRKNFMNPPRTEAIKTIYPWMIYSRWNDSYDIFYLHEQFSCAANLINNNFQDVAGCDR